jgi:hypothetical protein
MARLSMEEPGLHAPAHAEFLPGGGVEIEHGRQGEEGDDHRELNHISPFNGFGCTWARIGAEVV